MFFVVNKQSKMTVSSSVLIGLIFLLVMFSWDQQQHYKWLFGPSSVDALYYNNRNECNSIRVKYDFKFTESRYVLIQDIYLRPTRAVSECFFYMNMEFNLYRARLSVDTVRQPIMLEFMPTFFVATIMNGPWQANTTYKLHLTASRSLRKAKEGIVFRTFRHTETLVKSWYAIIKLPGMNCGSVIICVNNFVDLVEYDMEITYPSTHELFCLGTIGSITVQKPRNKVMKTCHSVIKRNPNDFQFAVAQFSTRRTRPIPTQFMDFITTYGLKSKMPDQLEEFWSVCQNMSLALQNHLGSDRYKPSNVSIYMLPNFDIDRPVLKSGFCYFTPAMLIPGSTQIYVDLQHCLIRQAFLMDRQFESWNMIWGFEGIIELLLGNFTMLPYISKREDYSDCLDGSLADTANLADLTTNVGDSQVYRPVRKAAGFWKMLERINLQYARQTYAEVYSRKETTQNLDAFLTTITKRVAMLNLTEEWFQEMLYSWTAPKGFPVLEAKVDVVKRKVCVRTYNWGQENYIGRYVLPFKLSPKYPFYPDTRTVWTHLTRQTCIDYHSELYPYLINRDMSVIARVLYDEENLLTWVDVLANKHTSNILSYEQKLNLVNDIFFFATNNRLDYMIALHYVQLLRSEVDERLWGLFDKIVAGLDSKARYTPIYNAFMQYIGDLMEKLYQQSLAKKTRSIVAIKWSCFMQQSACRAVTQKVVMGALMNHADDELPFDQLCAGIRRVDWTFFTVLMNSFGQPDWKEPHFYVQILACAENKRILRTLLLNMFYLDTWNFSAALLTDILLTMVQMGKPGSDAVFWYLDHDPMDMLKRMTMQNFLRVVDELATYVQYSEWLDRLSKRMHLNKILDSENQRIMMQIKVKITENKRWMNRSYRRFQEHVYEQYSKYVLKSEGNGKML